MLAAPESKLSQPKENAKTALPFTKKPSLPPQINQTKNSVTRASQPQVPRKTSLPKSGKRKSRATIRSQISSIVRLVIYATIIGLFGLWRREKSRTPDQKAGIPIVPLLKQVRTPAPTGTLKVDPSAFERDAVIINETAKAVIEPSATPPSAAMMLDLDADDAGDLDLLAPDDMGSRAKIARALDQMIGEFRTMTQNAATEPLPANVSPLQRRAPKLRLPATLMGQFEGRFGEELVWNGPLRLRPNLSGWVALTNQRLLWTTERQRPSLSTQLLVTAHEKRQLPLTAVRDVAIGGTRIPEILLGAAILALWFPYGTLGATLLLLLFVAVQRPVLAVTIAEEVIHLPIAPQDQREALRLLQKALHQEKDKKDQNLTANQAWGQVR